MDRDNCCKQDYAIENGDDCLICYVQENKNRNCLEREGVVHLEHENSCGAENDAGNQIIDKTFLRRNKNIRKIKLTLDKKFI